LKIITNRAWSTIHQTVILPAATRIYAGRAKVIHRLIHRFCG
jgi:hypothetical protein